MFRLTFVTLSLALAAGASAQTPPSPRDPRAYWLDEARGQAVGVNYDSLLDHAWRLDSVALRRLFELRLDGAGSETHSSVLWALLRHWRDARFARALRGMPDSTRAGVICSIDFAADASYARRFPQTFRMALHDPQCRSW